MPRALRVLLSEGSSLSARETITALGLAGYRLGVCDPNAICLGRFSRYVKHFYRCPPFGRDPWSYLDFVLATLAAGQWDVLFPAHEQAFLFARERHRFPPSVALAVAGFDSFLQVQGKAALVRTLSRLSLPQPAWRLVRTRGELERETALPFYLKADYTTASKAVWRVAGAADLQARISSLSEQGLLDGNQEFVVQQPAPGPLERVLAVFDRGALAAMHTYRQIREGPGGGDVAKVSVDRPDVRPHIERLGGELCWHGALSMDYLYQDSGHPPLFIDANPRLVEPMNAVLGGVNLADALVRISTARPPAPAPPAPAGLRTHLLLPALLSAAAARHRRLDVTAELLRAAAGRDIYAGSREELLPLRMDFKAAIPLAYVLARLFLDPRSSSALSTGSIASYSLSADAARQIAAKGRPAAGPPPSPR